MNSICGAAGDQIARGRRSSQLAVPLSQPKRSSLARLKLFAGNGLSRWLPAFRRLARWPRYPCDCLATNEKQHDRKGRAGESVVTHPSE